MRFLVRLQKLFPRRTKRQQKSARFVQQVQTQSRRGGYCWGTTGRRGRMQRIRELLSGGAAVSGAGGPMQNRRRRRGGAICAVVLFVALICYGGVFLTDFTRRQVLEALEQRKFLPIEHLEIRGNELVPKERIRTTARIAEHTTGMLSIDPEQIQLDLENIPWIRSATINRNWPAEVVIEVEEERAVALLLKEKEGTQQLFYMDEKGRAFLAVGPGEKSDLPVITGLSGIVDEAVKEESFADLLVLLRKIGHNNPYLPMHSLSEIHLTEKGEMVIYLVEYPFPIFFGSGEVKQKYWRLVQVLKPLYKNHKGRQRITEVAYIQMEYLKDKVLVATVEEQ